MKFLPTSLDGVMEIIPEPRRDERGFLARTYCEREFSAHGLNVRWVQQNHTMTLQKGSIRGMHYQDMPKPEIKLVRCVRGRVLDVVVDVRPSSPTFGQWVGVEISDEKMNALYIPAGFAHGFQCLEDECQMFYLMSEEYDPGLARGVRCDDVDIGVSWPLPVAGLSDRDRSLPLLRELRSL